MYIPKPYFKNVPNMGDLIMDNIFLENGYPVLFTCRNNDRLFLCLCRSVIEKQKWIISEIDIKCLSGIIHNNISIHDALKSGLHTCIAYWSMGQEHEEYIECSIEDTDLPDKEEMLDDEGESEEYLNIVIERLSKTK